MRAISDYKQQRDLKEAVHNITTSRYGIESKFFNIRNKDRISLEAIQDELEENIDGEDGYGDDATYAPEEGSLPESGDTYDDLSVLDEPSPSDSFGNNFNDDEPSTIKDLSRDGEFGEYLEPNADTQWQETELDDLKSNADCVNMMKIIANYTNDYTQNFEDIYKRNKDVIDFTGDFKASGIFNDFINPSMTILTQVFKDNPIMSHVEKLIELLQDKRKMISVMGKPSTPFLYEGMQLVLIETVRTLLALIPSSIKQNAPVNEVIDSMNLNVAKCLVQMTADLVEIGPMLGNKIYYVEPVVSEVTNKSEEITNTPYAKLDVFNKDEVGKQTPAAESIMNLVEIKNNNALLEFSALNKMMTVITGLLKDVDIAIKCKEMFDKITNVMAANPENTEGAVADALDYARNEVILPQIKVMAELAVKENEKMTEDPEMSDDIEMNPASQQQNTPTVSTEEIPEDGGADKIPDASPEEEEVQDMDEF